MKHHRRSNTALRAARRAVAERDEETCLVCGRPADDIAHVLPRRWKSLQAEMRNLVALCRPCHVSHENVAGRGILLRLLATTYGYEYEDEPYRGYFEGVD